MDYKERGGEWERMEEEIDELPEKGDGRPGRQQESGVCCWRGSFHR